MKELEPLRLPQLEAGKSVTDSSETGRVMVDTPNGKTVWLPADRAFLNRSKPQNKDGEARIAAKVSEMRSLLDDWSR